MAESALQLPYIVFKTQKPMEDYSVDDMRYGDLTESQLTKNFNLNDVSIKVNPYTLTKITLSNQPNNKVTRQECARILFDEMRSLSRPFAFYGPYKHLIGDMINHMQTGSGSPFSSAQLNNALKEQILIDDSENSSLTRIKKIISKNINWEKSCIRLKIPKK